uniref:Transcriptional regulator, LacI family n=1 Tax=uncultured Thiotrichaceae bacterium TaxID=298394 RepID=A0A6S6TLR3_9GAMM|nr:MAG: Transcriptional regulator, LacI family [uncultured Thiotrichaceae bacterium]
MQTKKPTLQDVADAAGVSTATVSRSLNQPDKVKPEVRETINTAIKSLGYVPHGAARALASRRSHTIGAVVPTIDNAIFSEAIQYLQHGLSQHNYTLLLAQSAYSQEEELREVQALLSRGIDGLVLVGEDHDPAIFELVKQYRIPYLNLWTYRPDSPHSCIGLDNVLAGQQPAKHLYELGHRKIGVITAILKNNDRARQRLLGVRSYLEAQGLQPEDKQVAECRYSGEQARQAMHELMARCPDLTAVICGNDILALGALCAARELGLAVPEDISVTGFDNLEIISVLSPALTTMHAPSRRMGAQAAEYLIQQIQAGTNDVERVEIQADLIVRETTGPVK